MLKAIYFLISLTLTSDLLAYSDGSFIPVSSNSFAAVSVDSTTPIVIPSTSTVGIDATLNVDVSSHGIREIVYANMSSSSTVFFSTSSNIRSILDHGFPIFAQTSVSFDYDPGIDFTTNTANRFYFARNEGSTELGFIKVRSWIRYVLTRNAR